MAEDSLTAVLHGAVPPPGDGMVVEVHLDIMDAPREFLRRLGELGFENDPFLHFHPVEYRYHYTGRTRASKSEMHTVLAGVNALISQTLREAVEAKVDLYAESELVRDIHHFDGSTGKRTLLGLEGFQFAPSRELGPPKADVHVEFRRGTVPSSLYDLMIENCFYWVVTPASDAFPSEEIATLQTLTFHDASQVYQSLVESPLPACTGIHLEQKLTMTGSRPGLSMPPVTNVTLHPNSHRTAALGKLAEMSI